MKEILKIGIGTFIGLTAFSIVSIIAVNAAINYQTQKAIKAMNQYTNQLIKNNAASQEKAREENERIRKEQQIQQQEQQAQQQAQLQELERRRSATAQAEKTCNYWKEQEAKENIAENRIHRENACALVFKMRTGEAWR